MRKSKSVLAAGVASVFALASFAQAQSFKITADTFVDSGSPGSPSPADPSQTNGGDGTIVNGQDIYSYGADTKVKAVASSWSSSYPFISYTHVLFSLNSATTTVNGQQQDFWTTLIADITDHPLLLANPNFKVTVNYFPVNDSLLVGNDAHTNMELHPLTHSFTVGNGLQNKAPTPPVPSTTGGATWMTYDGAVADAWTTPGGDFDAANFVDFSNTSPLPPSNGTVPFTWDITSLVANPTTRAELQNYGALIKVNNESQFPPVDPNTGIGGVNDFVSFDSANNTNSAILPTLLITIPGDANGDGVVNADDYSLIDRGYVKHLSGLANGDFNSDGSINSADYLIIDTAYAQTHAMDPSFLAEREAQFGPAYVQQLLISIPEPATIGLLTLGALAILPRRRRA